MVNMSFVVMNQQIITTQLNFSFFQLIVLVLGPTNFTVFVNSHHSHRAVFGSSMQLKQKHRTLTIVSAKQPTDTFRD